MQDSWPMPFTRGNRAGDSYNNGVMSTATQTPPPKHDSNGKAKPTYDPDAFRMTVGEHLEDLRKRLILSLVGLFAAMILCFLVSQPIITFLCRPLVKALGEENLATMLNYTSLTEPFMTFLKLSMLGGAVVAGPWIIYQIWQFVAAGLYPHERKTVTRYIPMSVTLFLSGAVFVYVVVLPITIQFFLAFAAEIKLPGQSPTATVIVAAADRVKIPRIAGNMKDPEEGDIWLNMKEKRLYVFSDKVSHTIALGGRQLLTPNLGIADYVELVITFMLTFGLAFQLPLVVMAVVSIGIVEVDWLKKQRKTVYFAMAVASAFIAPGDIVIAMMSLLIPMLVLYEFGLWMAARQVKQRAARAAAESE